MTWVVPSLAVLFLLLAAVVWASLSYARLRGKKARLFLLFRSMALLGVAVLFFRPACTWVEQESKAQRLAVLLDSSESMGMKDEADGKSRFECAVSLIEHLLPLLQASFQVEIYRFGAGLHPISTERLPELAAEDPITDLCGALRELGERDLAGIILLSDGRDTVSRLMDRVTVPVHAVGLGIAQGVPAAVPDRAVTRLSADSKVLAGDRIRVKAVVELPVLKSPKTVRFEANGRLIHTEEVIKTGRMDIAFDWTPPSAGLVEITARIDALPGESFLKNNKRSCVVEVSSSRIALLLFDSRPRWEFKFLKRTLGNDTQIEVTSLVRTSADHFLQQGPASMDLSRGLPNSLESLSLFDCIVIGDAGRDDVGAKRLSLLKAYVEEGHGGLILSGGRRILGNEGLHGTRLEGALPVRLSPAVTDLAGPLPLRITQEGASHPVLQGMESTLEGLLIEGLLGIDSVKPGGTILAAAETNPLLVVHRFGSGRCAVVLSDATWKWALEEGDDHGHRAFWGRLVRWASGRDVEDEHGDEERPVRLSKERLSAGESAQLHVSAAGEEPAATIVDEKGLVSPIELESVSRGFEGRVSPRSGGFHEIRVEGSGSARLYVDRDFREMDRLAQDKELLTSLAQGTNGGYYTAVAADRIAIDLTNRIEAGFEQASVRLEDRFWIYLIIVLFLFMEWTLRRRAGIV